MGALASGNLGGGLGSVGVVSLNGWRGIIDLVCPIGSKYQVRQRSYSCGKVISPLSLLKLGLQWGDTLTVGLASRC